MLTDAAKYDGKVHAALREFAINRPGLTINYLEAATRPQFEDTLHELLAADPELQQFTPEQKARLFELWSNHDPLDELLRGVQTHPEWLEFAWPGVARYHAGRHEFEEAWQLVRRYARPPTLPRSAAGKSIPELKKELYTNPGDYAVGYTLYRAQIDCRRDGRRARHRPAFHCATGGAGILSLSGSRSLGRKAKLGTRLAILAGLQTGEQE